MDVRELVAWNLRRLRVKQHISQEDLAVDAGVDRTYVGGIERGQENPTIVILDRLATALSIHISALFKKPRLGSSKPKPLRGGRRVGSNG
jgi:transcriptional regulator with XRE-family HTH domain